MCDFQVEPDFLDIDHDGLKGYQERQLGTDPLKADTDGGGLDDGMEVWDLTDPLMAGDDRGVGTVQASRPRGPVSAATARRVASCSPRPVV